MYDPMQPQMTIKVFLVRHSNGGERWFHDGHEACRFASGRVHEGAPARAVPTKITNAEAQRLGLA